MEVILAKPRGFCAGVVRAVEIVESALERYGPPVYVLHEIVHNQRVVADLRSRGAVFVESLDSVPSGATTIFSAHGVADAVVRKAEDRNLAVINATCPLVTKVHLEVSKHARAGREVVLIGHGGHAEVQGTMGQYDRRWGGEIYLVDSVEDVANLHVNNDAELAYVTQTTLSVNDAKQIVNALKARFPRIKGPRKDDICYATQNRQNAVYNLAQQVEVLLVVGARNSSNSNRLREEGEQAGVPTYLVQDAEDLDAGWLAGRNSVGIAAGASTPEVLVQGVLDVLKRWGANCVTELAAEAETVTFGLPESLKNPRGAMSVR